MCCWAISAIGQISTKIDTTQINTTYQLLLECPTVSKVRYQRYEEGFFKIINCYVDTAFITIHSGRMVILPLTDLSDKNILSEFILGKDIRIIRGYHTIGNKKVYFREDNYFKYGITFAYENVGVDRLNDYESYFNNIKIINTTTGAMDFKDGADKAEEYTYDANGIVSSPSEIIPIVEKGIPIE